MIYYQLTTDENKRGQIKGKIKTFKVSFNSESSSQTLDSLGYFVSDTLNYGTYTID